MAPHMTTRLTNALFRRLRVGAGLGVSPRGISPPDFSPHGISSHDISPHAISPLFVTHGATTHLTPHMASRHLASGQGRTWRQITASFGAAWVRGLAPGRSGIWPHLPKIITKLQNNYERKSGKIGHSKRNELQKLQNNYKRTFRPAAGRGRTWGLFTWDFAT